MRTLVACSLNWKCERHVFLLHESRRAQQGGQKLKESRFKPRTVACRPNGSHSRELQPITANYAQVTKSMQVTRLTELLRPRPYYSDVASSNPILGVMLKIYLKQLLVSCNKSTYLVISSTLACLVLDANR